MILKIASSVLILGAVFMGLKQGWAMLNGKPQMLEMFGPWGLEKTAVMIFGVVTIVSALLIVFPKTFVWGNFLMAATILLIICFHLQHRDLKGVAIELPFFFLNMIIIYLKHPFSESIQ